MNLAPDLTFSHQHIWARYRSNMPRYLIGISRYLQGAIMKSLISECGHQHLRLSFEPYISQITERGCRPSELAAILGISKQACNQNINEIELAGYIQRAPDPLDGRATRLFLTEAGEKLKIDGINAAGMAQQKLTPYISSKELKQLATLLMQLNNGLKLPGIPSSDSQSSALLAALLPRISDYMMHRLMDLNIAKGHKGLKMSYGQVISLIGLEGGRIQQMAKIQDVSKQAISAIANDLEKKGYIQRQTDTDNGRQIVLKFTDQGMLLLKDSVNSVAELEQEFLSILNEEQLQTLTTLSKNLYYALHIEEEVFEPENNLELLAKKLKQQLGPKGATILAKLLLSKEEPKTVAQFKKVKT